MYSTVVALLLTFQEIGGNFPPENRFAFPKLFPRVANPLCVSVCVCGTATIRTRILY